MKLIPILLALGMLAVIGCSREDKKPAPYLAELVKKAEAGDARAQYNVGKAYYLGQGVTQDYKEAIKWYTKSAEQGNMGGQERLGICYSKGKGVAKDEKEAVKWFAKSAKQGNERAKQRLEELKSK